MGDSRVLVIPGTSLVGLEILQSLRLLPGFEVLGAGTDLTDERVEYFSEYHALPRFDNEDFVRSLRDLVARRQIDYVYPANDLAISVIAELTDLGTRVVSHPRETVQVAGSKVATHECFASSGIVPERFTSVPSRENFPVFVKPDVGHSSIGAVQVDTPRELERRSGDRSFWRTHLVTALLVGEEVTVDCFSTSAQGLLYVAARRRGTVDHGVSVVTDDLADDELLDMAEAIQQTLSFNGPWFFQAKRARDGHFRLMEVAARLAGASRIRRAQGVNLAQLALLATDGGPLSVYRTPIQLTSWQTSDGRQRVSAGVRFSALYLDLDDTLVLGGAVNAPVADLAGYAAAHGARVYIVTRHRENPGQTLLRHGLESIGDIRHLTAGESKADVMKQGEHAVFVDDSFRERISCESLPTVLAIDASAAEMAKGLFDAE